MARGGGKVARARSHCLADLTLPIFRIGRKTTSTQRESEKGEKKTSRYTSGSCREKAGSLNHATTTTGLQKQTPHLLCWLLPQPTPYCHYLCLCAGRWCGLSVRAYSCTHTCTLGQAACGSRAFELLEQKGGHIWEISPCECRDKMRSYLSM